MHLFITSITVFRPLFREFLIKQTILLWCHSSFGLCIQCLGAIDNVQNKAFRYFLGVYRFAPIFFQFMETLDGYLVNIGVGLMSLEMSIIVLSLDNERITRNVYEIDNDRCRNNW